MNRADILRKCVERGVAGEAEVSSVSRLFYVHLLSALQRGQNVEVPKFGTFGTRVAGVRKIRKIPYFEPAADLAEKANQRFRDLKHLLVGTYEQVPAFGEAEFRGKLPTYDAVVESVGKDRIVDTGHEVSPEEYDRISKELELPSHEQEEPVMPRLNLRDDSLEEESGISEPGGGMPPNLRDVEGGGGGLSPVLLIALIVLVLGLGVFALNYFNVVHLWGKKPAAMTETAIPEPTIPEPEVTPPVQQEPEQAPAPSPTVAPPPTTSPQPKVSAPPKVSLPPSGSGDYTIQVSSWASSQKAEAEAARLTSAGYTAFVEDGVVAGRTWYRVRVGRYGTEREAAEAARALQPGMESDIWVARVGR